MLEVGLGVTQVIGSDRQPYTIVEVISEREIVVQEDSSTRLDRNGMSDSQDWRIEPNANGRLVTLTLRKNGRWVTKGTRGNEVWRIGSRVKYHDYSF